MPSDMPDIPAFLDRRPFKSPVDDIQVGERLRVIDPEKVKSLAGSMAQIGLQQPITVWHSFNDREVHLVAGLHRLEAAKSLGWKHISCIFTLLGELDRQLCEIDENLMRAELTERERSKYLKRRKEIFDAKGGEKIPTLGGEQNIGFDRDTADKTGLDKSTVGKARRRGERIHPDVMEGIKDLDAADNGQELDAIASLSHDDQHRALERVKKGQSDNFRDAKAFIIGNDEEAKAEAADKEYKALMRAWNKTGQEARDRFLKAVNERSGATP